MLESNTQLVSYLGKSFVATCKEGKVITRKHSKISFFNTPSPEEFNLAVVPTSYDDNEENNKAWKAYNKIHVNIIKNLLTQVLGPRKMTFNNNSGCSCGCSPAFETKELITNKDGLPIDVFVTFDEIKAV